MKRYRVKTAYLMHTMDLKRKAGDVIETHHPDYLDYSDQVALQAGFLEEVKEQERTKLEYELAGLMSTQGCMQHYHPDMCLPLAKAALTYLRSKMPISFKSSQFDTTARGNGYNECRRDVLRDVFGEQ